MQVEPLLVSNNASCLTSTLCLESGAVAGLGDGLERVGTAPSAVLMTDWPSAWQQQHLDAAPSHMSFEMAASAPAPGKPLTSLETEPAAVVPTVDPPFLADPDLATCCVRPANGPADDAPWCAPAGHCGEVPVVETVIPGRKRTAEERDGPGNHVADEGPGGDNALSGRGSVWEGTTGPGPGAYADDGRLFATAMETGNAETHPGGLACVAGQGVVVDGLGTDGVSGGSHSVGAGASEPDAAAVPPPWPGPASTCDQHSAPMSASGAPMELADAQPAQAPAAAASLSAAPEDRGAATPMDTDAGAGGSLDPGKTGGSEPAEQLHERQAAGHPEPHEAAPANSPPAATSPEVPSEAVAQAGKAPSEDDPPAGAGTAPAADPSMASAQAAPASAAGPSAAAPAVATDALTVELAQIMARCGGVSDTRFAGRLCALVEGEERLGGRLMLLSVVQQSSPEVLRLFVQGSGLRSLEQWVVRFRDEGRHEALIKVIRCLKMLPIDLTALKGSSIGQTVGKLRKHTNPPVRAAASELVDQWKGVVDRSVGKGEPRQGLKSKPDSATQDGPNKRARKADPTGPAAGKQAASSGSDGHGHAAAAASTSKLAVMDDDLFVSGSSGAGSGIASGSHHPGPHRPMGLTSFITGAKKVHAVKLENVVPGRPGSAGGAPPAAAGPASTPGPAAGAGAEGAGGEDGNGALPCPSDAGGATSPTGHGPEDGGPGTEAAGDGSASNPDSPKPGTGDAASSAAGQAQSLLPMTADGATSPAPGPAGGSVGQPKTVALPRLGTLAGPSTPTVRLGSLRDGSLPTSGIARLGAAPGVGGGVGGRAGAAASLPAAVAPGGPQSAHARAMAARARAPSPEPAPRKEKRKTVSWAGDEALALYRLFKKDDPPQLAASDAVLTAEDEAAAAADPNAGPGVAGLATPPGFQSAARREHASERMALIAQHQQEEQERQQELERWTAMRPTVPWVEPPELFLGAVSPQQLPALGEESVERDVQARLRQHTQRVVYYSIAQIPHSPGEPPPEPEPDPYRVRHIPLNVPGVAVGGVGAPPGGVAGPGALPPQPVGMLQPVMYAGGGPPQPMAAPAGPHLGLPPPQRLPPPYGGQLQSGQQLPGPPPPMAGVPQPLPQQLAAQPGPPQPQPGAVLAQPQPGPGLTLPPDLVASLPALLSSLAQQPPQPQQQPGPAPGPPAQGLAPGQPQGPPPPHALQHPHAHPMPLPHTRLVGGPHGGPPPNQPGQPPLLPPPAGPMLGPPGGPMRPLDYGMPPQPHPGMGPGPGPGPAGMPTGPGRPGSRFEPAPGPGLGPGPVLGPVGPGSGPGVPPPPPPRKEGQPTLMRPRRTDEPSGGGSAPGPGVPPGPPHSHAHAHPHSHIMGPPHGIMRHPAPHGHPHAPPHGMGGSGGAAGPGPGMGGWAPPPAASGAGGGPSAGLPPPSGHGPGASSKICAYFNTPGGCRNGEGCRFLHIQPQDGGSSYDNGAYAGPGRMGRPGGPPPPGLPGGVRRR